MDRQWLRPNGESLAIAPDAWFPMVTLACTLAVEPLDATLQTMGLAL